MKSIMKRILFIAAICCVVQTMFAQGVEVCQGTGYTIGNTVPATAGSEYRWVENGNVLTGNDQATYDVPNDKVVGVYTYVRQSKSAECPDWQSSNEFTVTVFDCSFAATTVTTGTIFTDPRDGKRYKTVKMPDDRTWFAQNLNYTKDLTYNAYSHEANGKQFTSYENGVPAIGSYWCPPLYWVNGAGTVPVVSGDEAACNTYGALYTWETAMMVNGKYADAAKTSSAWDELWVSSSYFVPGAASALDNNGNVNNARDTRGICPLGWHVPTDYEWAVLLDAVDDASTTYTLQTDTGIWGTNAGAKLKSASTFSSSTTDPGTGSWYYPPSGAPSIGIDTYGFGAKPAGYRATAGVQFGQRGISAAFWSSTAATDSVAWRRALEYSSARVHRLTGRACGISVRCVRD
jgi:uncharacterized protein (TIGR02145 family)